MTTTITPTTTKKGMALRLLVVVFAIIIVASPHLVEGLEKFNSPWLKALAAALGVVSTLFLDVLKIPLIRNVALFFLKREVGVNDLKDLGVPDQPQSLPASPTEEVKP